MRVFFADAARFQDGDTPLALAARRGFPKVIHRLLERGADPGATNRFMERPIDDALGSRARTACQRRARCRRRCHEPHTPRSPPPISTNAAQRRSGPVVRRHCLGRRYYVYFGVWLAPRPRGVAGCAVAGGGRSTRGACSRLHRAGARPRAPFQRRAHVPLTPWRACSGTGASWGRVPQLRRP